MDCWDENCSPSILFSSATAFSPEQRVSNDSNISSLEKFLLKAGEMILITGYKLSDINIGLSGASEVKNQKSNYYNIHKVLLFATKER